MANLLIYSIGHSTRSIEEFLELLLINKIELVADVRSLPGSKRFPHFNKENLEQSLKENDIDYIHIKLLGGRRRANAGSQNTGWRNKAFQAYADYMETDEFAEGIKILEHAANKKRTAFMCSEAVWWRCHRSLISDYLKLHGWKVMHILSKTNLEEHSYTQPAKIVDGRLNYSE